MTLTHSYAVVALILEITHNGKETIRYYTK